MDVTPILDALNDHLQLELQGVLLGAGVVGLWGLPLELAGVGAEREQAQPVGENLVLKIKEKS